MNGPPIRQESPRFYLETDASMSGWGVFFHDKSTQGRWKFCEQNLHINILGVKSHFCWVSFLCAVI
jgi:hypothetical protein